MSLAVGTPLTGIAAVAARPLIGWWMGSALVPNYLLVFWLGVFTLTSIAVFSSGFVLLALGRMGLLAISVALCAVATIGLSIQFAHWWGLTGIAFAMSMAALFVMGGSQFYMAYRMLNTRLFDTFEAESVPEPAISA